MSALEKLCDFLSRRRGAHPATLLTRTVPIMRIRGNPFCENSQPLIRCLALRNGFVGVDYEAAVNRKRVKQGLPADFVAGPMWHGRGQHPRTLNSADPPAAAGGDGHRPIRGLVRHVITDRLYVAMRPTMVADAHMWRWAHYFWADDHRAIDLADVTPWLKRSKSGAIPWRTIGTDNIVAIRIGNATFMLNKIDHPSGLHWLPDWYTGRRSARKAA